MAAKRRKSKSRNLPVASFVIRGASGFTLRGRRKIATWLKHQANHLLKHGDNYAKQFTARYFRT